MKKFISMIVLAVTLFSCSADEVIQEEQFEPNPNPIESTLVNGCYYVKLLSYDGMFHYSMNVYGDRIYYYSQSQPLAQDQLERWICP